MANEIKKYLDYEGLKLYDEKIKALIKAAGESTEAIAELVGQLPEGATEATILEYLENKIGAVDEKVGDISNLTGETVSNLAQALEAELERAAAAEQALEEKIDGIVDNAPEAFDTLKEIADWISEDEAGAAALVNRVAKNEDAIEALEADVEDKFNAIQSITDLQILALFPEEQSADVAAADAIADLPAQGSLKLIAGQEIAEDLTIDKPCYIDANGSVFEGTVSIPANVEVIIENATFANPVVVL